MPFPFPTDWFVNLNQAGNRFVYKDIPYERDDS